MIIVAFGAQVLNHWVSGPSGISIMTPAHRIGLRVITTAGSAATAGPGLEPKQLGESSACFDNLS